MRTKYFYQLIIIFVIFFAGITGISAQKIEADSIDTEKEDINQKVESIAEQTDAELDYTDLLDELNYYLKHPINLNNTNADELKKIIFLNDIQINNLLEHIQKNGKLLSIYELQSISGFDPDVIYKILPYVSVSSDVSKRHFSFKEMMDNSSNQFFLRYQRVLEEQEGFSPISDSALAESPNSRYLGSPDKIYARYRFTYYTNVSVGVTAEKDAGEEFFKGSQKNGFDFYSAHAYYKGLGFVRALAVGDYQVQFGQGLTLWSGLGFGKSSDAVGIKKNGLGLKPYTSVGENLFMRGAGTTLGYKNLELTMFYSNKKIDGNMVTSDTVTSEVQYISSIQETGLHATSSQVADKESIDEEIYGGHLSFKNKRLNIGATAFKSQYGAFLQHAIVPYNQFEFNGKENSNIGVDYSYIFRNFNIFGEVSQSENGGKALLTGAMISLDQNVALSVLYRNYEKDYQALYASAFSENSKIANEQGIFFGIVLKPFRAYTVTAYVDNVKFPWLKYRVNAPSTVMDYLLQVNYKPSKKLEMYLRYRQANKAINNSDEDDIIEVISGTLKQNYRFNASYKISPSFTLKSRLEMTDYQIDGGQIQKGYIVYQDVAFKKMKSPLSLSFRYALFDCDSYDSRMYAYESDVLYSYSIPAFYNKGTRFYLNLKYRVSRNIDLWFRFAQTYYSNINVISSGLSQINGRTKSEVKVQLRIKF
jgi:hypothetical protein